MDEEEFADFTSAFSTTVGSKDFHEIGGSVFEIPPLDDFVFDTSTIPLETHTSTNTHKPDELFGKFESSFEMTTSINNNSDASLPNGSIVSSTVPSLCSPPPLTDLPPLDTFTDFTSCDTTLQNISFILPQVPENIQKFENGMLSSGPKDSEKLENNDDKEFGEFTSSFGGGGGGESVGNDKDDDISSFANFSTFPSEIQTKEKTENSIFGDFSSFSQTPMTTEEPIDVSKLPDPLTMTVDETPSDEGFGNFASFENHDTTTIKEPMDISKLPDPLTTSESNEDDFGAFGTFQTSHIVPSTVENKEQFGTFTAFTNHSALDKDEKASEKPKKDEEPEHLRSDKMEDSDDEFGEFGSTDPTGDNGFGDFSGFNKATPPTTNTPVNQDSSKSTLKMSVDVIVTCFPVSSNSPISSSSYSQLIDLLVLNEDKDTEGTWKYMKKETVSPSSLYQWNQSLLQDRFYGSLKVDQMLVPTTSGIFGNDPFSFQSGGDLLQGLGFGFEGITASQAKDKQFGWSDNTSEEGATLLDLSLPISPLNQPEKGIDGFSFDSDLQGLDLTADIINPSIDHTQSGDTYTSWMDSELLELEVESSRMIAAVTTTGESTLEWLTNLSNTNPELTTMVKTDVSTSQTTPSLSDSTATTLPFEINPLSNDPGSSGLDQPISVAIAGLQDLLTTTVPPDLDIWSDTKETGTDDASVTSHDTGDITGVPDTTPPSSSRTSSLVRSPTISSVDIMLNQMLEDNNETAITRQDKGLSIEAKALLNKLPNLSFMTRTINKDQFV